MIRDAGTAYQVSWLPMDDPPPVDVAEAYRRYGAFVWRVMLRQGVRPEQAADAVQEVFLVLQRRRGALREGVDEGALGPWLFGVARNVARKHRYRAAQRITDPFVDSQHPAAATSAEQRIELTERARFVDQFLDALDEESRTLFILAVIEAQPVPKVAEILALNPNTAYSRVRKLRASFSAALSRQEVQRQRLEKRHGRA